MLEIIHDQVIIVTESERKIMQIKCGVTLGIIHRVEHCSRTLQDNDH